MTSKKPPHQSDEDDLNLDYSETVIGLENGKITQIAVVVEDKVNGDPEVEKKMRDDALQSVLKAFQKDPAGSLLVGDNEKVSESSGTHTLGEIVEEFMSNLIAESNPTVKTVSEYRANFRVLTDLLGMDRDIKSIGIDCLRDVKKQVLKLPRSLRKKNEFKEKTLQEILEMPHEATLLNSTLGNYFRRYRSLFDWSNSNGFTEIDASGPLSYRVKAKGPRRKQFEAEHLAIIFDPSTYPPADNREGAWKYWIPLILLFSGARLGEISQLYKKNVCEVDGIYCLSIGDDEKDQSIKNEASRRVVPVHSALLALGFREFVESQRTKRIFPELRHNVRGGFAAMPSRWFGRYLKSIDLAGRQLVMHSFRHSFSTSSANASGPLMANLLCGRVADTGALGAYHHGAPLERLREEIEKVKFPIPILTQAKK